MAGVSTQMTIRDRMTAKLNRIAQASARANRALETMDTLTEQVGSGGGLGKVETAANQSAKAIDRMNKKQEEAAGKAKGIEDAWSRVRSAIGAATAAIGAKKTLDLADSMTTTEARLNLITGDPDETAVLQDQIMASANRSRGSYQSTADMVAKLGIMAKDSFDGTDQIVEFTELINKQFTIAGTSAAGVDAAMLQLTQAMSSGVLRGEELNSIFEQAPTIIQTIADYLGVPIGQIRSMAAEGQITAEVVKNAMLASADEINAKFESMPMTFAQLCTTVQNILLQAFGPAIQVIGSGAQWIYDNWSKIEPVVLGVGTAVGILTGAYITYNAVQGISNTLSAVAAARAKIKTGANIAEVATTQLATGAQVGLNAALMACPITWVILLIALLIGAIIAVVQAIGGWKVALLSFIDHFLTGWEAVKYCFFVVVYWIMNLWDSLILKLMTGNVAIQNFMGDMRVKVLMALEGLINGAIDLINKFIGLLNKIPGVNIDLIGHVTFGTNAQLENEAEKQARNAALAAYEDLVNTNAAEREEKLQNMLQESLDNQAQRQAEIAAARAEAAGENSPGTNPPDPGEIETVENVVSVGSVEDEVNIAEEDLKFMRDVAEMRYVQNFVTLTPTVAVDAKISEKVDLDEVTSRIESRMETEFEAAAEGVFA